MSLRLTIVFAATVALGAAAVATGASQAAPAPGLDYEFFKTKVEPIFMKKRAGHSPCTTCHTGANNFLHLEELPKGATSWTEEQSRKQFESISKLVTPANRANSRLLIHPLAPEAGGDLFHSGGRQFASKDDPDYKILMQWVGVN
jgi:Spy/CpxP family protein refolding chaperone